jgi:hypothetical protein
MSRVHRSGQHLIDLMRRNGPMQELYEYWILGRSAASRPPRWSIIRDVLHWVP